MLRNILAHKRNALVLMLLLILFVAFSVGIAAHYFLQDAKRRFVHEAEQELQIKAGNQVALLTVWYGAHWNHVESFLQRDIVQLFAVQADASAHSGESLLHMAWQQSAADREHVAEEIVFAQDDITLHLSLMLRLLQRFMLGQDMLSARLVNTRLETYLAPRDSLPLSTDQKAALKDVRDTGKNVILPMRVRGEKLIIDMVCPIFAPRYIDNSGKRVASMLLYSMDVSDVIKAAESFKMHSMITSAILEHHGGKLRLLDIHGSLPLSDWSLQDGALPLAVRQIPRHGMGDASRPGYTLAWPVPDTPWLIMQAEDVSTVLQNYEGLRDNVILAACFVTVLSGIVLLALWWWLVAREARDVTGQIRRLYHVLQQQKQIMDGVNAALPAGVVLNDLDGIIYYANESYAQMAEMTPRQMRGLPYTKLPVDMARSLARCTTAVFEKQDKTSFSELLQVGGQERHYLGASTPFRGDDGELVGVVSVYSDVSELVEAQQRAQYMIDKTVTVFVRAIEAVDPYLGGHSGYTASLASLLADQLGLDSEEDKQILRTAASLSQIGMIQLPRDLLIKTEALSPDERQHLQQHVDHARKALSGIDFGMPILETITQMYERMDGSGYPLGLKGEDICLHARLLAVASTFCALVRPRSWRTAYSMEDALDILGATDGRYDLTIVDALQVLLQSPRGQAFLAELRKVGTD